ncbi:nucleolar complex protein 3 homolog [Dendrobium catenatum]|uniref:Nucleolar complex protein 3 homolog n=1 Tax=Dendrobium catenatum TaxID=906689 RepID=A0A2I0W730_9ASPA|nr:nucleolar complex protein 3 homolog [Dendrobium catenatum]PKU71463.1 hypothetical protein MA16_Dca004305 [Dendrobium catenatum]
MGKKKKVILPPQLPPDIPDEEIEVSEEDLDFVNKNIEYAGFLSKLDTNLINRHVTRVADYKEDELEALYEKKKKKASLKKSKEEEGLQVDRVDALPIKTLEGELCYRTVESNIAHKENGSASEVKDTDSDKGLVKLTKAQRRQKLKKSKKEAKRQAKEEVKETVAEGLHSDVLAKVEEELSAQDLFARKKIKLAEVGMALLEDPESNIKSLKELLHICIDEDHNIIKLGLMSLLAVFKDIIPGYRIRLPTEKELEMKVSKDVQKTRFYESTLLNSYKAYLLKLMAFEKDLSFHCIAVRCMCILLDAVPHFNFRENLVAAVVRNISSSDDVVRKLCCETIRSVFTNEGKHGGLVTFEAVRLIAELVKAHDCQLHPDSIEVFLSLVFDEDLGKSEPKEEKKEKISKKKKRKQRLEQSNQLLVSEGKRRKHELMTKTREELSADLKSVSFAPDSDERRRTQSEILSAVFGTYFRILKHCMNTSFQRPMMNDISSSIGLGHHPLLGPCLMGLGKFSHLIDLDFMGDLMHCLKKLAGHSDSDNDNPSVSLTVSEKLQCCIVAFRVMRNNLDALNVDLQEFYVQLYNLLLEYRPFRDRGDVLAEALKTMLWEGKQHDMQRAAAFVKRLATFALSFGSSEGMAALVTLKYLLLRNSKCRNLLENDPGGGSLSGLVVKYNADATDPHLSGALASVLWELSLLSKHYNPSISGMASSISSMASMNPLQTQAYLSTVSPLKAFEDLTIERELLKAVNRKSSFNKKGKRGSEFVIMDAEKVRSLESEMDEDVIERKFEEHFIVLRDIEENEKLRLELNKTTSALRLYEEYKQHRKLKQKRKQKKQIGG